MMRNWRSLLFVAAHDEARVAKVATRHADAVILDLEDAVPPQEKHRARDALASALPALEAAGVPAVVRINVSWRDTALDLVAAVRPGIQTIMVPKVEGPARLTVIGEMVAEHAQAAGIAPPRLIALIESPAGLARLDEVAAVDAIEGLALGSEDFSLALGVPPTPEALDLPCRMIALAAAPRGLMALGLPVSIATIEDEAAWQAAIARARAVGQTGALCIHPRQVAPVNAGFLPSQAELLAAKRTVAAWEEAGAGAIMLDGRMIDLPVVLAARKVVAMYASL